MQGLKLDTLENIEKVMPKIEFMLSSGKADLVGGKVVAPLAEAIATLSRELRQLRDLRK
jgi:Ran GTPase-activating protein (RanGAP) involved in mRNA processing and transport